MQSTEKQKFEENWKKAFDGAESAPPDRVWSSIELDLAGQESAVMKKRLIFWQRLAAAMLLFGLGAGAYGYYSGRSQEEGIKSKEMASVKKENVVPEDKVNEIKKAETGSIKEEAKTTIKASKEEQSVLIALAEPEGIEEETAEQVTAEHPTAEYRTAEPAIVGVEESKEQQSKEEKKEETKEETTVAIVSPLLQQTEQPDEVVQPKKKSRENNLWLALGASAGNYSPNTPSATTVPTNSFAGSSKDVGSFIVAAQPQRSEPKVGQSYSFGMAVGKKFGRVVIQTGVNLGKQTVEYTSNYNAVNPTANSAAKAASADYLDTQQNFAMAFTPSDYTVNSTMEIVSIPVQAGYMIIDRRIGWQFNAGVSPDFFLKNVLQDKTGQRETLTQSAGDASPYRSVNWSGLLNTELSYRIGEHYRLSFVPGVRYSFHSILKEPTSNGRPVIYDLGFRFKYLFD